MRNFWNLPSALIFGLSLALTLSACASKQGPRTDGPAGSEYGSPSLLDGELQLGANVGALIPAGESDQTAFTLGGDIDYRPNDLFGLRATWLQGLQKANNGIGQVTPLIHGSISNLRPYAYFGPAVASIKTDKRRAKFAFSFGAGGDFMLTESLGFGLLYNYGLILDANDIHYLGARIVYSFQ